MPVAACRPATDNYSLSLIPSTCGTGRPRDAERDQRLELWPLRKLQVRRPSVFWIPAELSAYSGRPRAEGNSYEPKPQLFWHTVWIAKTFGSDGQKTAHAPRRGWVTRRLEDHGMHRAGARAAGLRSGSKSSWLFRWWWTVGYKACRLSGCRFPSSFREWERDRDRCRLYLLGYCPWMSLLLLLYCPSLFFFSFFFCTARRALVYILEVRA